MIAAATRSLETAASGGTPKNVTSMGVINAPPPIPVRPTTIATRNEPIAIVRSKCIDMSHRNGRKYARCTLPHQSEGELPGLLDPASGCQDLENCVHGLLG